MVKVYNKAIRDKIPEIIHASGNVCILKRLDDDEFLPALEQKLAEEIDEYQTNHSIEELADLLEIIY